MFGIIAVVGTILLAAVVYFVTRSRVPTVGISGGVSRPKQIAPIQAAEPAKPKCSGWEVKFAGKLMKCTDVRPFSAGDLMLCVVRLTDRRTHIREIVRPLADMREVGA